MAQVMGVMGASYREAAPRSNRTPPGCCTPHHWAPRRRLRDSGRSAVAARDAGGLGGLAVLRMGLGGLEPPTSRLSGRRPTPPMRRTSHGRATFACRSAAFRVCLRRVPPLQDPPRSSRDPLLAGSLDHETSSNFWPEVLRARVLAPSPRPRGSNLLTLRPPHAAAFRPYGSLLARWPLGTLPARVWGRPARRG